MKKPFLWNFMKNIQTPSTMTGGEERPLTASANEENKSAIVEITKSKQN